MFYNNFNKDPGIFWQGVVQSEYTLFNQPNCLYPTYVFNRDYPELLLVPLDAG